jgi:Trypsin
MITGNFLIKTKTGWIRFCSQSNPINGNQSNANVRVMKTLKVCFFAIVTTFQLAPCFVETCGEARFVQVSDEFKNVSKLHFPWAGAIYSVVNKTKDGNEKFICGATLLTKIFIVTGNQRWTSHYSIHWFCVAAHCIIEKTDDYQRAPDDVIVYFGVFDLKHKNQAGSQISSIKLHPDWNSKAENYDGDLAVLKLRDGVLISRWGTKNRLFHQIAVHEEFKFCS